jgi:hypothetical protein
VVETVEGQYDRRDNAIEAVSAYCFVQEGCSLRRTVPSPAKRIKYAHANPCSKLSSPISLATLSVFIKEERDRPRRCFVCVGQALSLAEDDHRVEELISEFYMPCDLTRHFKRKHLSKLASDDNIRCQVCDFKLEHKEHFQNHALRVHGTVS